MFGRLSASLDAYVSIRVTGMTNRAPFAFFLAALLAACDSPLAVPAEELPLVRTDRMSYLAVAGADGYRLEVGYTFTNLTESTLYLQRGCRSVALERRDHSHWTFVQDVGACLDNVSSPILVRRDRIHRGVAVAAAADVWPAGEYRLRLVIADASTTDGDLIPVQLRASNTFTVTH